MIGLWCAIATSLVAAPPAIGFDNGSAEVLAADGMPVGWEQSSYGDIVGNVSVVDGDAIKGARYLRSDVLTGTTGDLRWSSPPAPVSPGAQIYIIRDWYRSTT